MVAGNRRGLAPARHGWKPTRLHNGNLAAPYIADGQQEQSSRLEKEADPPLDESRGLIENVKASLDEATEHTKPIIGSETGASYSLAEALARVAEDYIKVKRDPDPRPD